MPEHSTALPDNHLPSAGASNPTALDILRTVYGYHAFQGRQAEVIRHVASGGDALVLMPTGGGKSLCYQIPAMLRPGTGIVISPLIALMQDQVSSLTQMGVRAACLNSALPAAEQRAVEARLRGGDLDLLYVAPERLLTPTFMNVIRSVPLALFAIDEAHCVSQWGHDFRPEYTRLDVLCREFPHIPRLALTATADTPTRRDIVEQLQLQQATVFATGFDRPNISYSVVRKERGTEQLIRFIRHRHAGESGIVYRISRKKVEETAEQLQESGIPALPYHAGMTAIQRSHNQERFMREEGLVMVATVAFGMGVDKPNVRFVAHLEPPRSLEAYHQETGRAGRDGLPAEAFLTYGLADVVQLRRMIGTPETNSRAFVEHHKFNALLGFLETTGCRRNALLGYFGEPRSTPCDNCDTCLSPPETWDGSVAAQKALSAVYRTGQRFGVAHLTDILMGKLTRRITDHEHNTLKTFGCGRELAKDTWKSVFRQLVAAGVLDVDMDGHGNLTLNAASWSVLRGEQSVRLRRDTGGPAGIAPSSPMVEEELHAVLAHPDSEALLQTLRSERLRLAEEQDVPPYAIFPDKTLMEMVAYRPATLDAMSNLYGVGQAKLAMYGQGFLDIMAGHQARNGLPDNLPKLTPPQRSEERKKRRESALRRGMTDTIRASVELFRDGNTVGSIARDRNLTPDTIYKHLAQAIALRELTAQDVVRDIPADAVGTIHEAIGTAVAAGRGMGGAFEALQGRYPHGLLRCIATELRTSSGDEDW